MKTFRIACTVLVMLTGAAQADTNSCGSLKNGYGPFDYRYRRDMLERVEKFHFTPPVEALIRGQSTVTSYGYAGDISYLMGTSPNHHRGLAAIMRLVERDKNPQPPQLQYSIDCYFDRAIRFAPDDLIVRMLYAQYLQKSGKNEAALKQLQFVEEKAQDNPLTHFNIGLIYFDLGRYDDALKQAQRAKTLGLARTELVDRLREKGKWREANLPSASADVSAPVAAPAPSASQVAN